MSKGKVSLFYSDTLLVHTPPSGHPERPERLRSLMNHLRSSVVWNSLHQLTPLPASIDHVLMVHTRQHLETIQHICETGGGVLDEGDTHAVARSYEVAMLAAGAVVNAVDVVLDGQTSGAFCAVRPPGHHAERDRAMGFCLFNNVAIGARYAQQHHGLDSVAILDWDVHHGNGTQHIFEDDPTVFYISLHQYPFYPGTGSRNERGRGKGEGYTLNVPLSAGTGEDEYVSLFEKEIVPALDRFKPGLLLLSSGFDAHRDDPLGGMKLTEHSFGKFTSMVRNLAPIVSVLEGGYNLDALSKSVEQHLVRLADGASKP